MGPLVDYLKKLGVHHIFLIPTGNLIFLPLHAAWTEDATSPTGRHYGLDTIQFSYIPNAQSLQAARAIADRTSTHSLLAVEEPCPTKADELPNAVHEVQTAIASFPNYTLLCHEQATRSAMQALLPQHTALHFSGHGFAKLDSPLDSGLVMANDEILTLRDLLDLKLPGIRIAILSACETGLPGTQLPDEVISLPTGLLQAGVAGVVASLWSVADISTMMLLVRFYTLWQEENPEPAAALCLAQQWVRDTTNGEKLAYFKSLMQKSSISKIPNSTVDYLYKTLILSPPGDRDFAHPFHWAAFSYVGV
jgi:CHAT domain-containing protein